VSARVFAEVMGRPDAAALQADFRRDGYVVVRGLLERSRVLALRRHAEQLLAQSDAPDSPHAAFTQKALSSSGALRFAKLSGLIERDREFAELFASDAFVDVVELLLGPRARLFRDVLVVKPARTGAKLSAHQDSAYWDVEPMALVSAWVALGDVDEQQSPLTLSPATHGRLVEHGIFLRDRLQVPTALTRGLRWLVSRAGTGDNPRATGGSYPLWKLKRHVLATMTRYVPDLFDLQDFRLPPELVASVPQRSIPVAAGDVIFFHSLLWHSSSPNTTDTTRYAEIASYMPSNARVRGRDIEHFPEARRRS
jgi:ectoine hydroxylase-related dioxygenase (phytanoyl-CoA dioxygenase family)